MILMFRFFLFFTNISGTNCFDMFTKISYQELINDHQKCFEIKVKYYESNYFFNKKFSLFDFFKQLEKNNCFKSIRIECIKRTYNFSEYTGFVYDRFCNVSKLKKKCFSGFIDDTKLIKNNLNNLSWNNISKLNYYKAKKQLKPGKLTFCDSLSLLEKTYYDKEIEYFEKKIFTGVFCTVWDLYFTFNNTNIGAGSSAKK